MKVFALSALCLGCAWAQTAVPPPMLQAPPGTAKPASLPDLPDKTEVAAFDDGAVLTMGELRGLLSNLETQARQQAVSNLPEFLNQWALFHKLANIALTDKLDQDSPVKEQLLFARTNVLAQAEIQRQSNPARIEGDEIERYYAQHKDKYKQVKVDAIYISFSNAAKSQSGSDGKKILSEAEAKTKITGLLAQIRKGADFKKLAMENSDDEISRAKDGVFGTLTIADNIPDAIRAAVFALKTGETTDVIWQANGFYLFRAEDVSVKPLSEVRDEVYTTIKADHFQKWIEGVRSQTKAKILNPAIGGAK
jgi:peptidyl-prolyl cis-trans isomerase C